MDLGDRTLLILTLYRVSTLLAGLALTWMGYRLFLAGLVNQAGDVEAGAHRFRLVLKRAAPGTVFVVLGATVMMAGVWKGLSYHSEEPLPISGRAPSDTQGRSPGQLPDSVLNVLQRVARGQPASTADQRLIRAWLAQFAHAGRQIGPVGGLEGAPPQGLESAQAKPIPNAPPSRKTDVKVFNRSPSDYKPIRDST